MSYPVVCTLAWVMESALFCAALCSTRNDGWLSVFHRSLAEVCPDEEYNQGFPKLCEKVAKSKLPEDAR